MSNWKAVGGSVLQGGVTGGAAGLTGGASLIATATAAGAANVVGGTANRAIQGVETTTVDVLLDASIGVGLGAGGKVLGDTVRGAADDLTRQAKGKLGEIVTEIKYGAIGYKSNGKAIVPTGGTTPAGHV